MRTPLAYGRNGPTTDTRIRDAWPLDLEAWFNDITHGPDAHRLPRIGNLQVDSRNTRVVLYRLQDRRLVNLQMPVLIACLRSKGDVWTGNVPISRRMADLPLQGHVHGIKQGWPGHRCLHGSRAVRTMRMP